MKRNILYGAVAAWCLLTACGESDGEVTLNKVYSDGMVLQRGEPITLCGRAGSEQRVAVAFAGRDTTVLADAAGRWTAEFPSMEAGGPYEITAGGQVVRDVWIGDVWLCSGQSNMELTVDWVREAFADELATDSFPLIRHLNVPQEYDFHGPRTDLSRAAWIPVAPGQTGGCSALGYFFAKEMYRAHGVPVGIVNASLGGSPVESWVSQATLAADYPAYAAEVDVLKDDAYVRAVESADRAAYGAWTAAANKADAGLRTPSWRTVGYDDSAWTAGDLYDTSWQRNAQGRPQPCVYWMRRRFDAPDFDLAQAATFRFGTMEGCDSVFINGTFIGTTGYYYPTRTYTIPAGVLKASGNELCIRVLLRSGIARVTPDKRHTVEQGDRSVSLEGTWRFRIGAAMPAQPGEAFYRWRPAGLYDAMIAPLAGLKFRGVLWYQGESNTGRTYEYADLLRKMIGEWRATFEQEELPFYLVLLANYGTPNPAPVESGWAELRDALIRVAKADPHVGLASAIDLGEWNDIHPLDKKTLARRMADEVRRCTFGEAVVSRGPEVVAARAEGFRIRLTFAPDGGLLREDGDLSGFAVAGADGRFVWARAHTEGNDVLVTAPSVPHPVRVRYAWADNPQPSTLYNTAGLPALPFDIAVE